MYKVARLLVGALVLVGCGTGRSGQLRVEPGQAWRRVEIEPSSVWLPGFELEPTLVTRGAYAACVRQGACETVAEAGRKERAEQPMTGVTWEQADRYCAWQGKRLPTAPELERVREVHPKALLLGRDEWVDGWYTYYGRDFIPQVVSTHFIGNTRLVRGEHYYGVPSGGHPQVGFRCSQWLQTLATR